MGVQKEVINKLVNLLIPLCFHIHVAKRGTKMTPTLTVTELDLDITMMMLSEMIKHRTSIQNYYITPVC